jgi:hypothetical protein
MSNRHLDPDAEDISTSESGSDVGDDVGCGDFLSGSRVCQLHAQSGGCCSTSGQDLTFPDGSQTGLPGSKGRLRFVWDFEGGTIGCVKAASEFEYELTLRMDTNAPRFRLWFHYKVNNVKSGTLMQERMRDTLLS